MSHAARAPSALASTLITQAQHICQRLLNDATESCVVVALHERRDSAAMLPRGCFRFTWRCGQLVSMITHKCVQRSRLACPAAVSARAWHSPANARAQSFSSERRLSACAHVIQLARFFALRRDNSLTAQGVNAPCVVSVLACHTQLNNPNVVFQINNVSSPGASTWRSGILPVGT
jgi:hypothetical protein